MSAPRNESPLKLRLGWPRLLALLALAVLAAGCGRRTVQEAAVPWLREHVDQKFFLYFHFDRQLRALGCVK